MKLLIPPPVVAVVTGALVWFLNGQFPQLGFGFPGREIVALIIGAASIALDLISIGLFFRKKTTVSPLSPGKTEALVTNGLYAFTRNPMYLGLAGILTSWGIWLGTWWFVPAVALFVWYITNFQIKPEEEVLQEKFGTDFADYCARVRRWI